MSLSLWKPPKITDFWVSLFSDDYSKELQSRQLSELSWASWVGSGRVTMNKLGQAPNVRAICQVANITTISDSICETRLDRVGEWSSWNLNWKNKNLVSNEWRENWEICAPRNIRKWFLITVETENLSGPGAQVPREIEKIQMWSECFFFFVFNPKQTSICFVIQF